jgi:hypothetical protein
MARGQRVYGYVIENGTVVFLGRGGVTTGDNTGLPLEGCCITRGDFQAFPRRLQNKRSKNDF